MKRAIDRDEYQTIKKMFNAKNTVQFIADKYGVSRSTIYTVLRESGIELKQGVAKHKAILGKTFGYLVVTKLIQGKEKHHWQWRAICECKKCGKKDFETSIQSLLRGRTTSCGCRRDQYLKITGANSSQFTGYKEIPGSVWGRYEKRAEKKGRKIEVSIKDAYELFLEQNKKCALTGLDISFGKWRSETTASLDRIDNDEGYIKGNVQWVHKDVNIMKNIFPQDYFLGICSLVSDKFPDSKFKDSSRGNVKYGVFNQICKR
jgi:hypothetical protein